MYRRTATTLDITPIIATLYNSDWIAAKNKYNLPKKPASGGKPTIENIIKVTLKANAGLTLPKLVRSEI